MSFMRIGYQGMERYKGISSKTRKMDNKYEPTVAKTISLQARF